MCRGTAISNFDFSIAQPRVLYYMKMRTLQIRIRHRLRGACILFAYIAAIELYWIVFTCIWVWFQRVVRGHTHKHTQFIRFIRYIAAVANSPRGECNLAWVMAVRMVTFLNSTYYTRIVYRTTTTRLVIYAL